MVTYPFDGWDFTELCSAWGLPYEIGDPRLYNMVDNNDGNPLSYTKIGPVMEECPDWFDAERVIREYLDLVLTRYYLNEYGDKPKKDRVMLKTANDLRCFLKVLSEDPHVGYYRPVWVGLSQIECDESLIKISMPLIGYMWS